jgi:hypothetical protein
METMKNLAGRKIAATLLTILMTISSITAQDKAAEVPLVALDAPEGALRLKESEQSGDFFRLIRYFSPQKNLAYCGVASSVMVLNALPGPKPESDAYGAFRFYTQENLFCPAAAAIKAPEKVAEDGLSLDQLTGILNAQSNVKAEKHYASSSSLEEFRTTTVSQLNSDSSYVLVNYLRKSMGQSSGGHISPVGAYHKASDSFLILDVSQYKYPPVWVPAAALWSAMAEVDAESQLSRGYVVVGMR